jgi:hypothetical protein
MKFKVVIAFLLVAAVSMAEPQRRGGGGRPGGGSAGAGGAGAGRAGGSASVNRDVSSSSIRSNQDVTRSATRSGDVNRNVDVDREVDVHGDVGYDRWGHPIAAGAVVGATAGAAAAATSAALGSTVAVLPPSCSTVVVNGVGYSQCGSAWYQPFYSGTTVQYMAVSPPQ